MAEGELAAATQQLARFPKHGWTVKLDHKFPEQRDQNLRPSFKQIVPQLVPLGLRYFCFWLAKLKSRKKPVIDQFRPRHSKMMYGVPCGGLGSATIGRGFRGEFCRFQMVPGMYEYHTVPTDQFILTIHSTKGECLYQSVLGGGKRGEGPKGAPSSWQWRGNPEDSLYSALYPRAWTVYNITQVGVRVICRQVSPFLPGDYANSCLPVTLFTFTVENNSRSQLKVSITLTFKNGTGGHGDGAGGVWTQPFSQDNCKGVLIHQRVREQPLTYCLGAATHTGSFVSWCAAFDPKGGGEEIWDPLREAGVLDSQGATTQPISHGQEVAAAVSNRILVEPQSSDVIELCLAWHNPTIKFRDGGKVHRRYYTRYFGIDESAGPRLVSHALRERENWERAIEAWQEPVLSDPELPAWFKSAVYNELYYLADGGSVWLDVDPGEALPASDLRQKYGRWGYLESHEYRMYNTYDVHYYASWALADLFPGLELSLQVDFLDWADRQDKEVMQELYSGHLVSRKVANTVPHDLGDPEEEPWIKVNSYNIHDVSEWRDLNLKLIIQIWRDVEQCGEEGQQLLVRALPTCNRLMETALTWDKDGDSLIENSGWPDQTFDSWVMSGASAYCGGLWLAALAAMADMADMAGISHQWRELLGQATAAYVGKLWNGSCFSFDQSPRGADVIMADQLAGYWYRQLGSSRTEHAQMPLIESDKVKSALRLIFDYNVQKFSTGRQGAVNGMLRSGEVDKSTVQSEEVWTGVTYGLASLMLAEGMIKEGFATAEGIYRTVYETIGLGFETPEAIYETKHYRAIGYMRPLSIWAMAIAWRRLKQKREQETA